MNFPATSATDRAFEGAAELFALLSAPTRLRIVCELCEGEKSVGELLDLVGVRQPNISQHLGRLYRGGVLGRKRVGSKVVYRIVAERARLVRDAVCAEQASALAQTRSAAGTR